MMSCYFDNVFFMLFMLAVNYGKMGDVVESGNMSNIVWSFNGKVADINIHLIALNIINGHDFLKIGLSGL